jgi:hypothetical protein
MRCYFMRDDHIIGARLLNYDDDEGHIGQARKLFELVGKHLAAEGFEVWNGPRFVFRFPPDLKTPQPRQPP